MQCSLTTRTALLCVKLRSLFVLVKVARVWSIRAMIATGTEPSTRRKSCSSATLCTTNITWTGLTLNLRQAGDRLPEACHGLGGQSGSISVSRVSWYLTERCFVCSLASPACPYVESRIRKQVSMERWWNYTDRGKRKFAGKTLSH